MEHHENSYFSYSSSETFPFSCLNPKTATKHIADAVTQTDFPPKNKFLVAEDLFGNNEGMILNQESKMIYMLALNYINKFHVLLNNELNNLYKNYEVKETFKCPQVSNYSSVFPLAFTLLKDQTSSKTDNKTYQSNVKAIDIAPDIKLDHQSTELNIVDNKIQDISVAPKEISVLEQKNKPSDICSIRELELMNQNIQNKITKKNIEEDSISFQFHERSKQVQQKTNLVPTSFNVFSVEPQKDLQEYPRRIEKINKPASITPIERPRPILPSPSVRTFVPKKMVERYDAIYQGSKYSTYEDSDESVILDDEEFELRNKNRNKLQHNKNFPGYNHPNMQKNFLINGKPNPLRLNKKDLTNITEKTLSSIGLFTDRGEVKPDVIEMLEREKSLKANDMRNKKFRCQRQWDSKIQPKPKVELPPRPPLVSEDTFLSYSDVKLHVQNVE